MKSFKLSGIRVLELQQVVDSLQPKEFSSLKEIRMAANVAKDLGEAIKELSDAFFDFNKKQFELLKTYQERFKNESEGLDNNAKNELLKQIDKDFKEQIEQRYPDEQKKVDELGKGEIEVELGDEKFDFLKTTFSKHAKDKYLNKEVLLIVADALGVEE